jgi:hypothetical protein
MFSSQPAHFFATTTKKPQVCFSPVTKKSLETPVDSSDAFKIVIILDESGSMDCIRHDMVKAMNDLITEQKQIKDRPCRFTLVKFNDEIKRTIMNMDLQNIQNISASDYKPDRTTALYDAIGSTVEWFRYEKNVLMVIITDGQDNASKQYSKGEITAMLDEKQKNRGWSYVYLSNDLSTAKQGDSIGLKQSKCATNVVMDQTSYGDYCRRDLNSAISNFRKSGVSVQSQLNSSFSYPSGVTRVTVTHS